MLKECKFYLFPPEKVTSFLPIPSRFYLLEISKSLAGILIKQLFTTLTRLFLFGSTQLAG